TGFAESLKDRFEQLHGHLGMAVERLKKLISRNNTHLSVIGCRYSCATWLVVYHAHFAEGFARVKVGKVNVFAFQVLGHFNSTTLDDIRCLTLVVFPDNDFATLVLRSGNHGSPPRTLVIIEIFAVKNLILDAHACQFDQPGGFVPPAMLPTMGASPLLDHDVISVVCGVFS